MGKLLSQRQHGKYYFSHNECTSEPMNLTSDFRDALPQFPVPNVVGARWSYQNAIAKSLQELGGENVRKKRECMKASA